MFRYTAQNSRKKAIKRWLNIKNPCKQEERHTHVNTHILRCVCVCVYIVQDTEFSTYLIHWYHCHTPISQGGIAELRCVCESRGWGQARWPVQGRARLGRSRWQGCQLSSCFSHCDLPPAEDDLESWPLCPRSKL